MRGESNFSSTKVFGILFVLVLSLLILPSLVSAQEEAEYQIDGCEDGYYPVYQNWAETLAECESASSYELEHNCYVKCQKLIEDECWGQSDCDDDNECTNDYCFDCSSGSCLTEDLDYYAYDDTDIFSTVGYCEYNPKCDSDETCDSSLGVCKEVCAFWEDRIFSCEGTYRTTVDNGVCSGWTYVEENCDSETDAYLSFLSLISGMTGKVAADIIQADGDCWQGNKDCSLVAFTATSCNSLIGCSWDSDIETTTHSCSPLSEYSCDRNSGCTTAITCEVPCASEAEIYYNYDIGKACCSGLDSITISDDGSTSTLTCCPSGETWDGSQCAIPEEPSPVNQPSCTTCEQSTECATGLTCQTVYGTSEKVCVSTDYCAKDITASCETSTPNAICTAGKLSTCQSDSGWSTEYTCPNGCTADGTACIPDTTLEWTSILGATISTAIWSDESTPAVVKMTVRNANPLSGNFGLYESDATDTSISGDETINANIASTVSGNDLVYTWTLSLADLDAAAEEGSDNTYEFFYTWNGEESGILTVTKTFTTLCGNGVTDTGETYESCPEDIYLSGDTICESDKGESCANSPSDCGACIVPEASWTQKDDPYATLTTIQIDADNISGQEFRMLLINPSGSQGDFELKEFDSFIDSDDIDEFEGSTDTLGGYSYIWTTTYSNFWDAASSDDGDNIYEFFFEIDGSKSGQLVIEVLDGDVPTCEDGIPNGDETGLDCGGECPDTCPVSVCDTVKLCKEYDNEDDCNADTVVCDGATALKSIGTLTGDQTATCYWDTTCKAKKTTIGVGDCNYAEDYGEDTCDEDGFLTYSYDADFIWSENNNYSALALIDGNSIASNPDYIEDGGWYHYDPTGESLKCQDGSRTVQCPAQIQLTFFTWLNLVAAAVLIIIAYLILVTKKKKVIKKKAVAKKTVKKAVKKAANKKTVAKKKK